MTTNTLSLAPGTRLRTGGTTYEVLEGASVPAGVVPVVPQAARLLKVFCESCGYTCRITQRWITKAGTPECPSGHGHMVVEVKGDRDDTPTAKPAAVTVKAKASRRKAKAEVTLSDDYLTAEDVVAESELEKALEQLLDEPPVRPTPTTPVVTAEISEDSPLAQLLAEL